MAGQHELTPEQQKMVTENMALVNFVIKQLKLRNYPFVRMMEHDEMFQYGSLGLCRAALYFDPKRGFKFSTYAFVSILNMIKANAIYSQAIKFPHIAFRPEGRTEGEYYETIGVSQMSADPTIFMEGRDQDRFHQSDCCMDVEHLISVCDERSRNMMLDWACSKKLRELSKKYGVSGEAVRVHILRSLKKIRLAYSIPEPAGE